MTKQQLKTRENKVRPCSANKIFILHGWAYSKDKWNPFLSLLKSERLNPYLFPIPGLTDKIDKPWTIDDYINWLLDKTEKEEKIILIGHSNGGRIALNFSIRYPEKIARLILIDSAGVYHNEISIVLKRSVFKILAKAGKKIINNKSAKKLLYKIVGEEDYSKANENMKKTMVNLIKSDKNLEIEKIINPTTIIWGEKDNITPVSDARLLNEKLVNSKLYIINGSKHSPQFTHPKEVVSIITEHL